MVSVKTPGQHGESGNMSHGKTPAFYGHLDKSVVIFENEQGRTLAGTKSRCDYCFTLLFLDVCGLFFECRIRSPCACGSET